jgi:hypothetical protein
MEKVSDEQIHVKLAEKEKIGISSMPIDLESWCAKH